MGRLATGGAVSSPFIPHNMRSFGRGNVTKKSAALVRIMFLIKRSCLRAPSAKEIDM